MVCEVNIKRVMEMEKINTIATDGSFHGWSFFFPVGMCRFHERGVVITCVPVTAPVGKGSIFISVTLLRKCEAPGGGRGLETVPSLEMNCEGYSTVWAGSIQGSSGAHGYSKGQFGFWPTLNTAIYWPCRAVVHQGLALKSQQIP